MVGWIYGSQCQEFQILKILGLINIYIKQMISNQQATSRKRTSQLLLQQSLENLEKQANKFIAFNKWSNQQIFSGKAHQLTDNLNKLKNIQSAFNYELNIAEKSFRMVKENKSINNQQEVAIQKKIVHFKQLQSKINKIIFNSIYHQKKRKINQQYQKFQSMQMKSRKSLQKEGFFPLKEKIPSYFELKNIILLEVLYIENKDERNQVILNVLQRMEETIKQHIKDFQGEQNRVYRRKLKQEIKELFEDLQKFGCMEQYKQMKIKFQYILK